MFVGAGLPSMEETALADPGMTFFQRIARTQLDPLSLEESARGAAGTHPGGREAQLMTSLSRRCCGHVRVSVHGAACRLPLLGAQRRPQRRHTSGDVQAAIDDATTDMEAQVFTPIIRDLSRH